MAQALSSRTAPAQTPPSPTPQFLDENFKAIRLMVYDILEGLPKNNNDRADQDKGSGEAGEFKEGENFKVTRKSLRLVCKQVEAEWTSAFLRSTTICLDRQRTPQLFETVFLPYFSDCEVKNIRRLAYNWSSDRMFASTGVFTDLNFPDPDRGQVDQLFMLSSLIRKDERLRLETIDVIFCDDDSCLLQRGNDVSISTMMMIRMINSIHVKFGTQMMKIAFEDAPVARLVTERGRIQVIFRREKPSLGDAKIGNRNAFNREHDRDYESHNDGDDSRSSASAEREGDGESENSMAATRNTAWDSLEDISGSGSESDSILEIGLGEMNHSGSFDEEDDNGGDFEGSDSDSGIEAGSTEEVEDDDGGDGGHVNSRKRRFSECENWTAGD